MSAKRLGISAVYVEAAWCWISVNRVFMTAVTSGQVRTTDSVFLCVCNEFGIFDLVSREEHMVHGRAGICQVFAMQSARDVLVLSSLVNLF